MTERLIEQLHEYPRDCATRPPGISRLPKRALLLQTRTRHKNLLNRSRVLRFDALVCRVISQFPRDIHFLLDISSADASVEASALS